MSPPPLIKREATPESQETTPIHTPRDVIDTDVLVVSPNIAVRNDDDDNDNDVDVKPPRPKSRFATKQIHSVSRISHSRSDSDSSAIYSRGRYVSARELPMLVCRPPSASRAVATVCQNKTTKSNIAKPTLRSNTLPTPNLGKQHKNTNIRLNRMDQQNFGGVGGGGGVGDEMNQFIPRQMMGLPGKSPGFVRAEQAYSAVVLPMMSTERT